MGRGKARLGWRFHDFFSKFEFGCDENRQQGNRETWEFIANEIYTAGEMLRGRRRYEGGQPTSIGQPDEKKRARSIR